MIDEWTVFIYKTPTTHTHTPHTTHTPRTHTHTYTTHTHTHTHTHHHAHHTHTTHIHTTTHTPHTYTHHAHAHTTRTHTHHTHAPHARARTHTHTLCRKKQSKVKLPVTNQRVFVCGFRLEKLAKEFYLCVQAKDVAQSLQLDEETVDFIYNYWMLKRRVGGASVWYVDAAKSNLTRLYNQPSPALKYGLV